MIGQVTPLMVFEPAEAGMHHAQMLLHLLQTRKSEIEAEIGLDVDQGLAGDERAEAVGGPGHGLVGMRERVLLLGGHFDAGARPGGGFRVAAHLPLVGGSA